MLNAILLNLQGQEESKSPQGKGGGGYGIWILKATQFYHDSMFNHFLDHFL